MTTSYRGERDAGGARAAGLRFCLWDGMGAGGTGPGEALLSTLPQLTPPQASGARHPQRRGLCGAREALPGTSLRPGCTQHLLRQHAGHQVEGQEHCGPQAPTGPSLPGAEGGRGLVWGGRL